MSNESNIRHGRHCIFKLHVHWVFVAKYRRRVFDAQAIDLLRGIFDNVCSDAHATRVQMDGEDDHVHRRSAHQHRAPIHRAAEDPELTFTTASLSALTFP